MFLCSLACNSYEMRHPHLMDRRIEIVILLMKDDLHRQLSLTKLAHSVGLSLSRLHHLFKAETGTTPTHYLHTLRSERAKALLETSSLSIEEVMIQVGVRDRSHFDREFKHECGMTPKQYREAARLVASVAKRVAGSAIK